MIDIETRVSDCFANAFPGLSQAEIKQASHESLARWDSVAHVTLISALAEEFHCELDEELLENLTSYKLIVDYFGSNSTQD